MKNFINFAILKKGVSMNKEEFAIIMHDLYEKYSHVHNWKTDMNCRDMPFDKLPENNQLVMLDVAEEMLKMFEDKIIYQDSYTEKCNHGTLKVYLNMKDLKECEEKLKHFVKLRTFVNGFHNAR